MNSDSTALLSIAADTGHETHAPVCFKFLLSNKISSNELNVDVHNAFDSVQIRICIVL